MRITPRGVTGRTWAGIVLAGGLLLLFVSSRVCLGTGFSYGLWLNECPDGELKQTVSVSAPSLARGGVSSVTVSAFAHYTTGNLDLVQRAPLENFSAGLTLQGPAGEVPIALKKGFTASGNSRTAEVEVPKVNDGDYTLRVKVKSRLGETTLDVPVAFYAPARIHLLTDRPLYEPGNTVQFRAVALKASDLSPLDGRPGTWRVSDAEGTVLLEEKAAAGNWGVVAGTFPIDKGAASGTWTVTWSSGAETGSRTFEVKPFTLPRFTVEATAAAPHYGRLARPVLKGEVRYASGAPVANAKVDVGWLFGGEWPPPRAWVEGTALPKLATANAQGRFTLELPQVPEDLTRTATLTARLGATDASGDRVEGTAQVLLSEDPIAVSAITELSGGLVEGFNNRVFLRGTTADGRVLSDVTLNVKRLWEPSDKGTDAVVDEDGVASLQLDPGPPVNVVVPPMPFRPPPRTPAVSRSNLSAVDGDEPTLADRLAFDRVEGQLESCARYVSDRRAALVAGLQVSPSGAIQGLSVPAGRLGACAGRVLSQVRLGAGPARVLTANFSFNDAELPKLEVDVEGVPHVPDSVEAALSDAMVEVRDCLPPTVESGSLPRRATWRSAPGKAVELSFTNEEDGVRLSDAARSCIESRLARVDVRWPRNRNDEDDEEEEGPPTAFVGTAHFEVSAPERYQASRPQATVMTGYEFLVTARVGGELLGKTKLFVQPGQVPNVRLRASSNIVKPGETVTVELLRGPDFAGELPKKLYLTHGHTRTEASLDAETRTASFTVPKDVEGWAQVAWSGAQVFLFVEPPSRLTLTVKPEHPRYAPGQVAQLSVETTIGGAGRSAAVGLFGVDNSLAQLAPLPGADDMSGVRPEVTSTGSFGGLDAQALSLGRIRGKNAALATLLRVSSLPSPAQVDTAVSVSGATVFDPNEQLVDRFYLALAELHAQVREWEASAPAAEKMKPPKMAALWKKSLAALDQRKQPALDAFGRPLRLHRLPSDLLSLTEPRAVVVTATRLPEDLENWSAWVKKEQP